MSAPLIIFGTGTFSAVAFLFFKEAGIQVEAFTADADFIAANQLETFEGRPVVPFETVEDRFSPQRFEMFVAMGYSGTNAMRTEKFLAAKAKGYRLASLIHPTACVASNVRYGENCLLLEQVVLQPYVSIGNNVFFWTGAAIFHHTVVQDHCFIGGRSVIAGCSRIGEGCFIGTNAIIRDYIELPAKSIVGAGAVVLKSPQYAMVHRARPAEQIAFDDWKGSI
jgi:sugar O-acyltransferase (sialic acid O-acetyltransferase NeuD family)